MCAEVVGAKACEHSHRVSVAQAWAYGVVQHALNDADDRRTLFWLEAKLGEQSTAGFLADCLDSPVGLGLAGVVK